MVLAAWGTKRTWAFGYLWGGRDGLGLVKGGGAPDLMGDAGPVSIGFDSPAGIGDRRARRAHEIDIQPEETRKDKGGSLSRAHVGARPRVRVAARKRGHKRIGFGGAVQRYAGEDVALLASRHALYLISGRMPSTSGVKVDSE